MVVGGLIFLGVESSANSQVDLVEADNEKTGYAYKDEFYDMENQPNNPEEAMVYMKMVEKNVKKYGYYRAIPIYEADGKTEIGSFKINRSS